MKVEEERVSVVLNFGTFDPIIDCSIRSTKKYIMDCPIHSINALRITQSIMHFVGAYQLWWGLGVFGVQLHGSDKMKSHTHDTRIR